MRRRLVPARLSAVVPLLLALFLARPFRLHAQDAPNHLYDKFSFTASGADVVLGSTFRIDNADGTVGTEIEFGTLGLSQNAFAPLVGATWRPGRRHQLQLSYLYVSRSGEKVLTDTVRFADTSFAAGLRINSKFSAPSLSLAYRFAFVAKEKVQVGAQVTVGALFFGIDIDALAGATAGGADTTIAQYSSSRSLTGPTAALGLYGAFRAGNNWYLGVEGGAIGAKISNISATSWVFGGDAKYFVSNHWAFGAGWNYSGIKVTIDKSGSGGTFSPDFTGTIKYGFNVFRFGVVYAL